jgi:hypothetical protein
VNSRAPGFHAVKRSVAAAARLEEIKFASKSALVKFSNHGFL